MNKNIIIGLGVVVIVLSGLLVASLAYKKGTQQGMGMRSQVQLGTKRPYRASGKNGSSQVTTSLKIKETTIPTTLRISQ
jgi:hypothetical protein